MNESTLTQLKIIVERAVRPVRASTARKRKMREELLAHVSGVFEEEAKLGDDSAALQRTALRFGNPAEVTVQLQEAVPASDGIVRRLEGRPDESILRGALRFAWIEGALACVALGAAFLAAGWLSAWSIGEMFAVVFGFSFLCFWLLGPLWLLGTVLVAHGLEKSLHGRVPLVGWPRVGLVKLATSAWGAPALRGALIVGGLCLLVLTYLGGFAWPLDGDWTNRTVLAAVPFAGALASSTVVMAWILVQTVAERRRCHAEWASLPIEPQS